MLYYFHVAPYRTNGCFQPVPCAGCWTSLAESLCLFVSLNNSPFFALQSDKMIPLHLRKKMRSEKPKPKPFEVMPPVGSLMPGQRTNVQVKFMPSEEVGTDACSGSSVVKDRVAKPVILRPQELHFFCAWGVSSSGWLRATDCTTKRAVRQ